MNADAATREHRLAPDAVVTASGRLHTVLIVEDDADNREALADLLECEGYDVLTADNGQSALNLLRHVPPPRLILLDLMMPVMDGWQFVRRQHADALLCGIPVIVLSGAGEGLDRLNGHGVIRHFAKPVNVARLLDAVEECCR